MAPLPLNLAVEDDLSEAVLRKILRQCGQDYAVGTCYGKRGFGYLKRIIPGLNNAARGTPFLVLTDLDASNCAPEMIREWLPFVKHNNLIFRVAVREVESWVLADRAAFAKFVGVRVDIVPNEADEIRNTKEALIGVVKRSRRKDLRNDIVPPPGSTRKQGPNYNGRLVAFIQNSWDARRAAERSPSLRRTLDVVSEFCPMWET